MSTSSTTQTDSDMTAMRPLHELMRTLPQELFDRIYEYTSSCNVTSITITRKYKSPPQLALSRAIRTKFAAQYYTRTITFRFKNTLKKNFALAWLKSLPYAHLQMIQGIQSESPHHISQARDHFDKASRYISKSFMETETSRSRSLFIVERNGKALQASFERIHGS
ncbi:hypothetical protein HII31_02018 [Pseudocercospora fuligena]|uniref:F-box domain-containing protein n=1 Tax=Pseudocercospora fuligena TaxID=685502 RepID=A0A8H6VLD0_9PEZI|nr:hypothetical protein HII31_02018 [Pseudocercospora fuligena]